MYLTDYHLHSKYSFDGKEELDSICDMAVSRGIKEIAVTDHMDLYAGKPYGHILDCDKLYKELEEVRERYAGRLIVRLGAELGQPQRNPEEAKKFLEKYPLDFVIGSIHNMEDDFDIYYYEYDRIDMDALMESYNLWLLELAEKYDFDVLGHITYPSRYYFLKTKRRVDFHKFWEQYRQLFHVLIQRGKGIEVNTSGLYGESREAMPNLEILKLYKECGGEIVTIGSDAHKKEQAALKIREAAELLKEAGFSYLTAFEKRKPVFQKL